MNDLLEDLDEPTTPIIGRWHEHTRVLNDHFHLTIEERFRILNRFYSSHAGKLETVFPRDADPDTFDFTPYEAQYIDIILDYFAQPAAQN